MVYPTEKTIGGSNKEKNKSFENTISFPRTFNKPNLTSLRKSAVMSPSPIATVD